MKLGYFKAITASLILLPLASWVTAPSILAANPAVLQAKKDGESKGFIFETGRDEIVAKARKEGSIRALSSLDPGTIRAMADAFRRQYPFLDVHVEEMTGTDAIRRFILEMKANRAKGWDVAHISEDSYNEFIPHLKKFDLLGMAQNGVFRVPTQIIDPVSRNVLVVASGIQVVAFNKKLITVEKLPDKWEDFLRPEFKGRKFVADIRPTEIATLVPEWGLEKTLDFARKIAAQQPVWGRGATRTLTAMAVGEYALFIGANFNTLMRVRKKDPSGALDYKILEPVPTRLREAVGILTTADHPYAALLWLEFQATPKGQKILDEYEPYGASVFVPGTAIEKLTIGKKLSLVKWDHYIKMPDYQAKIVEAYGFPNAEK